MALRLHLPHRLTASTAPAGERLGLGARVYAVEPARISLEERLLGILRHEKERR